MHASEIKRLGGTLNQQSTSVAKVSLWHIPLGSDYANATIIECFFDDAKNAEAFVNKYSYPPEMAVVVPFQHTR